MGLVIHVMQSQAATEVGIGFESATSTSSSSQSSTIDTTMSSSSTTATIVSSEMNKTAHLSITEVTPIVYEENGSKLVTTSSPQQLPRTGDSQLDKFISLFGCLILMMSVGLLVSTKRRNSSGK